MSTAGERHRQRCYRAEHAARRRTNGAGIQPAEESTWGVLGGPLSATAIEADEHLHRCLVYIDLNMVRVGAIDHPFKWVHSGYREMQRPPKRYAIIDLGELTALCGFAKSSDFQFAHRQWVERALEARDTVRDDRWSETIAVGNLTFVETVKTELSSRAICRAVEHSDGVYALREQSEA